MKYLEQLQKIESELFDNVGKPSQKTIDLVQNYIIDFETDALTRDDLWAINYQIDTVLKVWNPDLKYDIDVLKRFNKIIADWSEDV